MSAEPIRALLARALPGYEVASVALLGEGLDHVAYEVNGELIVRRRKEPDPEEVRREADLLTTVTELSPLPVPEVVLADAEGGVLAYRRLPGVPLLEQPVADPTRLAPALGAFLTCLHLAPLERMTPLAPLDDEALTTWLDNAAAAYLEVRAHLPGHAQRRVRDFLGRPPPREPATRVFCHNDLGAEHLLVNPSTGTLTGVIDWTDAAVADPAHDLGKILRDLGPAVLDATLAHYGAPWDAAARERAVFHARCALLEDLAFGLGAGPPGYAEAALANLERTFA